MKRLFVAALIAGLVLPVAARAQRVGLAGRAGVFGVGGEASVDVNRFLGVRGGIGSIPVQPSGNVDQVNYTIKPPSTLQNIGVDLYPLGGAWRLSGGLLFKHDINLEATASGSYEFNNQTYQASDIGTVTGLIAWKSTAPYATMGWSGRGRGFGLFFDFGAAFLGEPKVLLDAKGGPLSNDPTFRQNLVAAQDSAQHDAGKYMKYLPIVSLGIRIGI